MVPMVALPVAPLAQVAVISTPISGLLPTCVRLREVTESPPPPPQATTNKAVATAAESAVSLAPRDFIWIFIFVSQLSELRFNTRTSPKIESHAKNRI